MRESLSGCHSEADLQVKIFLPILNETVVREFLQISVLDHLFEAERQQGTEVRLLH